MDTVVIASIAAIIGAVLTFLTSHRDSSTKANSIAVEALSTTIEQLRRQIAHLNNQLHDLDARFIKVMAENENLVAELHSHRKLLASYGNTVDVD